MAARIEDYALLGDLETAALVGPDGSVDWLCLPRFDSPACFAGLLGEDRHGHWRLAPADGPPTCASRRYLGDTLVLETRWDTEAGSVRVLDLMPHRDRHPRLLRVVEGLSGRVPMRADLRLRFNYGRVVPWVRRTGHHRVAVAGPDSAWLRVPPGAHTWGVDGCTRCEFEVAAGERATLALTWQPSHLGTVGRLDPEELLRTTEEQWTDWSDRCDYRGPGRDAVLRSLITLKALVYAPTGGVVAAPTASLPERIGGSRNWDYRFCWLRDSSLTLNALLRSGYRAEAAAWRRWLLRAIAGDPADLQAVYGVAGERALPETHADWLPGYEGSAPVRLGNAAVRQLQLDVYGEVLDTLHLAWAAGIPMERQVWSLVRVLMDGLAARWQEPDEGLWEIRDVRRHFVHSKVMCWVAADRAVRLAEGTGLPAPLPAWRALRDAIRADVLERGVNPRRGLLVQAYGSTALDASALLVARSGFLPPDDPRLLRTVEAVRTELDHGGLIRRYTAPDGLPGAEGAFLACSFWLADALGVVGRRTEGRELLDRCLGLANDVGLFAEEWDPDTGRQLGNHPQAFTHVALVNAALSLSTAQSRLCATG